MIGDMLIKYLFSVKKVVIMTIIMIITTTD